MHAPKRLIAGLGSKGRNAEEGGSALPRSAVESGAGINTQLVDGSSCAHSTEVPARFN